MSEKDRFYLEKDEPLKSCLLALRAIILSKNLEVSETKKYGMPCLCYGEKIFCCLWTGKKTGQPYILFVAGNLLNHPHLESGDLKRMKIFRVDPGADLPKKVIES